MKTSDYPIFKGSTCLITGPGSWGSEITRQLLLKDPEQVIIFSRNESAQVAVRNQFKDGRLRFVIGDIRDAWSIMEACRGVHFVFHTSALKHIAVCENQPNEAVMTNVIGIKNVIDACIRNDVQICVNISSDKVCHPVSTYGQTKAIAEALITEANNRTVETDFFSLRSGNIIGSSGSVIPLWISQIKRGNEITVNGNNMSRYFITVEDAVKSIFDAMRISDRGEVFVPKMDCYLISDLAKVIIQLYGNEKTKIRITEQSPFERSAELLITPEEICRTAFTKKFYIIYPVIPIRTANYLRVSKNRHIPDEIITGEPKISGIDKLIKLVKRAGF